MQAVLCQGAPFPASLIHAGFVCMYQLRLDNTIALHLLSWFSSLIMELGAQRPPL
jgi:hypothetical protein